MTIEGWGPIEDMIATLRQLATADREQWPALHRKTEGLLVVCAGSPAPIELQLMAAAAKHVVRQMPHAPVVNESELRGVCQALANIIKNGMDFALSQRDEKEKPYYLRGGG